MKTYIFKVVVEPDDDRWSAYCPLLLEKGASTWGATREEALRNIQEVVEMVVESLLEEGEAIPGEPAEQVQVMTGPRVIVNIA